MPPLVSRELWEKANRALTERGRGRGKQGKTILALLRNRIFCPICGRPMVVRRNGHQNRVFYHCSRHYRPWDDKACTYRRFVPGTWDELVWDFVCALLSDSVWIEEQLKVEGNQRVGVGKLLSAERNKIAQIKAKIAKIQEGFESGIYTTDEARNRIASYQNAVAGAEQKIEKLQKQMDTSGFDISDVDALRHELKALSQKNLKEAAFDEKCNLISKLDIRVYPSEDLKAIHIKCGINLRAKRESEATATAECGKIIFAPP